MKVGDIVVLTEALAEKKWWVGYQENDPQRRTGEFPSNYVQVLPAAPGPAAPAASSAKLRPVSQEELAAVKVQALYRGHRVRQRRRVAAQQWRLENSAAVTLQSRWRGNQTRRRMPPPLPEMEAWPPALRVATGASRPGGAAADRQPRPSAPLLPPQRTDAEKFAAKAAAWDEMRRRSPTHDVLRSVPPPPPSHESTGDSNTIGVLYAAGSAAETRTNSAIANARDQEEARIHEAMAALDELERTRSDLVEAAQGHHPDAAVGAGVMERDPAAKRRLFLMAHSGPGESPVFLTHTNGGAVEADAAAGHSSPRSTLSLSPATDRATPALKPIASPQIGLAMAAARGQHAALEALLEEQAAVAIQAAVRGRQARRRRPPALLGSLTPSASLRSPISPSSPGREARAAASMQLREALVSLGAAESRAESLQVQLSRAESALASQATAAERDASVREETKAQLQGILAARMREHSTANTRRRLVRLVIKSWCGQVTKRHAEKRQQLDAAFVELERSVSTYREEASTRAEKAEATHARMQARLAELEASLVDSQEAEANAQAELEAVRTKAGQLGSAMQSRVVAAEAETESCRAELQAAMRDQEDRHATRIDEVNNELEKLRAEATAKVVEDAKTLAELRALRGVDDALKEVSPTFHLCS